jgi:hypothetical protein
VATRLFHDELRGTTWWPLGFQMKKKKKNLSLGNLMGTYHSMLDCKGQPNGHQVSKWEKTNLSPRDLMATKSPNEKKKHNLGSNFFFPHLGSNNEI